MKLLKSITDTTPGAVFVAKSTGHTCGEVWPAVLGIDKHAGCVEYGQWHEIEESCWVVTDDESDMLLNDHCGPEEAWLVKPHGKHYLWIRVDHKLKLLRE